MSIKTFAHKGAEEVFYRGRSRHVGAEFHKRKGLILDAINGATGVVDLRGARGISRPHWRSIRDFCDVGQRQLAADLPL